MNDLILSTNPIVQAFLIFLPAGIANMAPPLANKIPLLNRWTTPLDMKKTYKSMRLFGDNKTFRGLACGVILGSATLLIETSIISNYTSSKYSAIFSLFAGGLLGFGALTGDAIESFFKRKRGIKSGHSWFPFDQTDYIIGGLLAIYPFVQIPINIIGLILAMYFGLHLVFSYIGFLLGFKSKPI